MTHYDGPDRRVNRELREIVERMDALIRDTQALLRRRGYAVAGVDVADSLNELRVDIIERGTNRDIQGVDEWNR